MHLLLRTIQTVNQITENVPIVALNHHQNSFHCSNITSQNNAEDAEDDQTKPDAEPKK